ncbi:MarR family transcriptional regulator [Acinetobacter sp. NIPH 1852]|uniref:MarR family winged helix-turn-helix transcriptional regulator n=1 Tax=unclassified Acinetobacter TaxID=196816 RepID=UPI0002CE1496|nr:MULTISPECIES: MarR family transcriptional regulator [unclassified Acinetobacter]ENU29358.1 hypothetical protein F991_02747 [Acinetobacter sp. CIP-A165]ENW93742.1 hypothetical protein F903_03173 [Acinetobacter sp. NIPH 298]MCH7309018.1 MarR family transcriptional regulator [Acinetobacter sp. NIPH 1852]MDR7017192.1 DNA-binding MarR family transcriptional regulator [Prolinoborus sp. 3657]
MDDAVRVLQSVRRIEQCVELYSKRLSQLHQITTPQLVALMTVAKIGPCSMSVIGKAIFVSPSTVVGIIDRLEEKGLVLRVRDTQDRRHVHVSLTAKGEQLLDQSPSALPEGFSLALQALTNDERQHLIVSLERFAQLLEAKVPN